VVFSPKLFALEDYYAWGDSQEEEVEVPEDKVEDFGRRLLVRAVEGIPEERITWVKDIGGLS
jgi:hypothetical protein